MMPFNNTPNNGGEYKAWLIRQTETTTVNGAVISFDHNDSKTNNFKVRVQVDPKIELHTEVNVTRAFGTPLQDLGLGLPAMLPVVNWNSTTSTYDVDHATISFVTQYPNWDVRVQDRALVTVNLGAPTGTVSFTLYDNDLCTGEGLAKGSSSTWTLVTANPGANVYASGLSEEFFSNTGGMWAFRASYAGDAYGSVTDLGCEAWPIPSAPTDLQSGGASVTGGSVVVDDTIHDTVVVSTGDTTPIPSGSTVEFLRYTQSACQGAATSEIVNLTGGAPNENAQSSPYTASTHELSYRAILHSGNQSLVPSVADGCELVTVFGKPLDIAKNAHTSFKRTYSWTIAKTVDGAASSTKESATPAGINSFAYQVTVSSSSVDSDWTVSGQITLSNPNPWSVTVNSGDITDTMMGGACTVASGNVTVAANDTASVNYSCTGFTGFPTADNNAAVTYTDEGLALPSSVTLPNANFGATVITNVNNIISVSDNKYPGLGLINVDASGGQSMFTSTNPATIVSPAIGGTCTEVVNTATIVGTEQSASATAKSCTKVGTKTQGYWQPHTAYTTAVFGSSSWTTGSKTIDSPAKVFSALYSSIPKKSNGKTARTALDQARMQMLQQWVAAKLNCHAANNMGCTAAAQTLLTNSAAAWGGSNATLILSYASQLDAYNNSNDTWNLPGGSATAQTSQSSAASTLVYCDVLP